MAEENGSDCPKNERNAEALDGYEKNYQLLKSKLKDADFGERALALGFRPDGDGVRIDFFGREYRLNRDGVYPADGKPSLANHRSLLIHYLLSPGEGGPGEEFLTLWQMPGVTRGRRDPGADLLNDPAFKAHGDDYASFRAAALALGGEELKGEGGWREWLFRVLPKVRALVGHLPADEEFPAEIRTRFDAKAPNYLEFECLAFLCHALSVALAEAKEKSVKEG